MIPRTAFLLIAALIPGSFDSGDAVLPDVIVDDFESYTPSGLPTKWQYLVDSKRLEPVQSIHMAPKERFYVEREAGNQFGRVYTDGEAVHLTLANGAGVLDWNSDTHPTLSWDWRARKLPVGAREDVERLNDTGVAMYVIFKLDGFLIRRPRAIKYTYSSTLPVGTVVSYGSLKVIVVSSARDGYNRWVHVERNVMDDYRRLFGEEPPSRPLSLRLWGDSDNTGGIGEADFDNITLVAGR